jgi:4-alpha-glucanotransferase
MSGRAIRSAGILLHPTSLPGPHGIGDLGPEAHRFVDLLAESGMTRWQMLPLGPPDFGGSPYNAESSFAGNHALISLDLLVEDGLLDASQIETITPLPAGHVDFPAVEALKDPLLRSAWETFRHHGPNASYDEFRAHAADWLDDYALYRALKRRYEGQPWNTWDRSLRLREDSAIAHARAELAGEIEYECFLQWLFDRQWAALRRRAHAANILVVGDVPMFPAYDSADVWAGQHLFKLDTDGQPTVVTGVPPDYFSETGQLWGNPHYDWAHHAAEDYRWWSDRFRWAFHRADIVRIDHFRGFESAWEVDAGQATAVEGRWVPGPGLALFERLGLVAGHAIIAEDLGTISDEVRELLQATGFPGMKVLQFAFGSGPSNDYLPHNHVPNAVAYTGTHDNDTTVGWLHGLDTATRKHLHDYLGPTGGKLADALIRAVFASVAETAIVPMQDVLLLGREHRMNTPAVSEGNWTWRFEWEQLPPGRLEWLRSLAELYGRHRPVEDAP